MWHNIFTFVWFTCTLSADMKNFITEKNNTTLWYNPQIQISAESETKRSIFREKDKTKRSKKESAQHSKSRNKSFVMTSVSAL
jgi:alpha-galactosidase